MQGLNRGDRIRSTDLVQFTIACGDYLSQTDNNCVQPGQLDRSRCASREQQAPARPGIWQRRKEVCLSWIEGKRWLRCRWCEVCPCYVVVQRLIVWRGTCSWPGRTVNGRRHAQRNRGPDVGHVAAKEGDRQKKKQISHVLLRLCLHPVSQSANCSRTIL